jgi:F-type H+-transporting ATPase subunit gamma
MATLKAIRKRISSIRNTQQITKAMKMVSAAKLRRAQEAAVAARPYAEKMTDLLKNLAARVVSNATRSPCVKKRIQLHCYRIAGCAAATTNLIRAAEAFRREQGPERKFSFQLIGRRGRLLPPRHAEIADRYVNILATPLKSWR